MSESPRPSASAVAADDQVRAEARDRLQASRLFFLSSADADGQRVLGSVWATQTAALDFLFGTLVSVWEWLADASCETDAEIVSRLMLGLADRRRSAHDEGGEADGG